MEERRKRGVLLAYPAVFLASLLLFCLLWAQSAQAGWIDTPQWRYVQEDGTLARDQWVEDESGDWYYLDENGIMCTGFLTDEEGNTFFLSDAGVRQTGLIRVDGAIYYLDENGHLVQGG